MLTAKKTLRSGNVATIRITVEKAEITAEIDYSAVPPSGDDKLEIQNDIQNTLTGIVAAGEVRLYMIHNGAIVFPEHEDKSRRSCKPRARIAASARARRQSSDRVRRP